LYKLKTHLRTHT